MRTLVTLIAVLLFACSGTDGSDGPTPEPEPEGSETPRYCNATKEGKVHACYDSEARANEEWQADSWRELPDLQWMCELCECTVWRHNYKRFPEESIEPPKLDDCSTVEVRK